MKNILLSIGFICLSTITTYAQKIGESVQYIELIKNHSFEDEGGPIRNRRFGPNGEGELFGGYQPIGIIPGWINISNKEAEVLVDITTEGLLDETQHRALRWVITRATSMTPAGIANVGIHGIEVTEGNKYTLTFWMRADNRYKGKLRVGLQRKSFDNTWYAQAIIKGHKIKKKWKKYSITFVAKHSDENACFVITSDTPGTLYMDEVSLYSPTAIKR